MVLTEKLTFILACKQTCDPTEPMLQVGEGVGDIGEGVPVLFLFQLFWCGDGAWELIFIVEEAFKDEEMHMSISLN